MRVNKENHPPISLLGEVKKDPKLSAEKEVHHYFVPNHKCAFFHSRHCDYSHGRKDTGVFNNVNLRDI